MSLNYEKVVKGLTLLLFSISSIISFIKPNSQVGLIAVLSIVGFISFELIQSLKNIKQHDSEELKKVKVTVSAIEKELSDIKSDHSLAHLAATFKRK